MNKKLIAALLLMTPFATACQTTRAQTPIERPALDVPPVPPRVIEPPPPEIPTPDPVGDLPPQPANPPRSRPQPRDTQREASKPDPKPEAPPVEPPAAPPQPATPVPPLRTPATTDTAQAEREIREVLGRSGGLLNRVDYGQLSNERKKAYDQAKLFIEQAETALKESKFEFARELAGKAETLAKELQTRS
jgi:hypothetical protein